MTINLKEEIIRVATDLFMKQGYVATSTRQLASILHVSQPAIYHHYKSKEEIFTQVITQFALEVGKNLNDILKKNLPKKECLTEMALYLRDNHEMNFSLMMNDLQHSISKETNEKIFLIWHQNYFKPFIHFFETMEPLIIKEFTPIVVAQHFLRIIASYISESPENSALDRLKIEDMVQIFYSGITQDCKSHP